MSYKKLSNSFYKGNVLESNNAFTQIFIQYEIKKAPTDPFGSNSSLQINGVYRQGLSPNPSPTRVRDDSCSQIIQHTKHTQVMTATAIPAFTQANPFHYESIAYNLLFLFLGRRGILIAIEWVIKHYWLGDELQQEYLILVFFCVSAIMLHNTLELSSPLKNQQLFFGFGKKMELKTHNIDTRS